MATTAPIKEKKKIMELKNYFLDKREFRNHALVCMGMNTALRISDILALTWDNVYDFNAKRYFDHLYVVERKTNKKAVTYLNKSVISSLQMLFEQSTPNSGDYIFQSRIGKNCHISRNRAYCILKDASKNIDLGNNFSCHSLRKTFGYHAWKEGIQPAMIMSIYNHSSFEVTKHYLCIDQEDKDAVFRKMEL